MTHRVLKFDVSKVSKNGIIYIYIYIYIQIVYSNNIFKLFILDNNSFNSFDKEAK